MPRFVDPSNGNVSFISDAALANPTAAGIDLNNMSAVWIDGDGNRWSSNGSNLILLSSVSGNFNNPNLLFANNNLNFTGDNQAGANAPIVTSGSATPYVAVPSYVSPEDSSIRYFSGKTLTSFLGYLVYNGTGLTTIIDWVTLSAYFDLYFIRYNTNAMIYVDGQPVSATPITTDAAGSAYFVNLDFSGVVKPRKITIIGANLPFGGFVVTAGEAYYSNFYEPRIASVMGDSYTAGNGALTQSFDWASQMCFALGYLPFLNGVGGTGWLTTGSNSFSTRLNASGANALVKRQGGVNSSVAVNAHFVAGGYNDASGNVSDIPAAITEYAAKSNIKPILIGPWTPLGSTAQLTSVKDAIELGANQNSLKFVNINNFVNSVNKATLTGVDNVHPTASGHLFLGNRIAQIVRENGYA